MQPLLHTTLATLLVVSNVTLAQSETGSSVITEPAEPRMYLAQAPTGEARPVKKNEAEKRKAERGPTDEEALALAALEGLMAQPSERALPIIKRVLSGSQSTLVKQRALFVLSQIGEPEAQVLLLATAKSADPALRAEAIRSIGIGGDPKSVAALQDLYGSGDEVVKKQVLEAWMISGSKEALYQAALNAKSDEDATDAIRMLGAMGASEELRKLGDQKKPGQLIDAYAISGDLASLRKIADGSGDLESRLDAIRKIGIIHNEAAVAALREIYTKATTPELKDAALQGMLVGGDEQSVLALYRTAQTAEEKRALLRTLSFMGGDAALQAIDAALEGKK